MTDIQHTILIHRLLEAVIYNTATDDSSAKHRAHCADALARATHALADNAPLCVEVGNIVIEVTRKDTAS